MLWWQLFFPRLPGTSASFDPAKLRRPAHGRFWRCAQSRLLAHRRCLECVLGEASVVGGGPEPARFVSLTSQALERCRMTGAKAPLKSKTHLAIRQHLKSIGSIRDRAMFNIASDARLRGCDLMNLRLGDIAQGGVVRQRSTIIQQKTDRPVPFEITEAARDAFCPGLQRPKRASRTADARLFNHAAGGAITQVRRSTGSNISFSWRRTGMPMLGRPPSMKRILGR